VGLVVEEHARPGDAVAWQAILGYLNFSEGRPDPRFQTQLNDACRCLGEAGTADLPAALTAELRRELHSLHASGASAFRDIRQAEAVLAAFRDVLPAYRRHHADLLGHQQDRDLFQPFFLARVFEAVLVQAGPWHEHERIVTGALARLNDFAGFRPIPVLESGQRREIYDHERVAPIPLYLRGAGVAWGRYHDLVTGALEVLRQAEPQFLADAQFDPELLTELALDPRAYDHNHPANRRPNNWFGEWDPHQIDEQGRYRRFIVRQLSLEMLLGRVEEATEGDKAELLWESSAVLAGIILMAAGLCGSGPAAFDSSMTYSKLVPKIAAFRDSFYSKLLAKVPGQHGERLRQEAAVAKQPFGGVRRHLNHCLARHRAAQLQQRHLAVLFAEMGYPEISREQAAKIPTPSLRLQSEILIRIALGNRHAERGELAAAAALLPEAEDLLHRGIDCGAFADPWSILGFQGLYPVSNAREESVHDHRIDELIYMVERQLDLYARLLSEAAAARDQALADRLRPTMRRLAEWWDQFASPTVSDVRRLHAGELADAAEHVATALSRWREQGEASAGLAFWKKHQREFQTPKAFAQVVEALLGKADYRAAMALLMSWLSQAELVPLEDGQYSFHTLARRWLLAVSESKEHGDLVPKFFDVLEANAEEFWDVPELLSAKPPEEKGDDEDENPYEAAYEGVTYRDSTDDGNEGAVVDDDRPLAKDFTLEEEAPRLEKRLRFLSTVAQLWQIAGRGGADPADKERQEYRDAWLKRAIDNRRRLVAFLQTVDQCAVPEPLGSFDSMVEFEQRRSVKERLLEAGIGTALETSLAIFGLLPANTIDADEILPRAFGQKDAPMPKWLPWFVRLELALRQGDADAARNLLPRFVEGFRPEQLLIVPLAGGGNPRVVLQARLAQAVLRTLLKNLPRLGLLHETHDLLRVICAIEQAQPAQTGARRVTEFERFFRWAWLGVVECIVESAKGWDAEAGADRPLVELLKSCARPFYRLWSEHSGSLQLSSIERLTTEEHVQGMRDFIKRYGRDLFHAKFLTPDNLRGILHRGIGAYFDSLRDNPDPKQPVRLIEELDTEISRDHAVRWLELILHILVENYEELKDYTATTAQGAYGDNLHVLMDFLRLKAVYHRQAWQNSPLVLAHQVLAKSGRDGAAQTWEKAFSQLTSQAADEHLAKLAQLEAQHGVQLRTISDRLNERFIKPLAIDRLCVLAGPALDEARQGNPGPGLARFLEELAVHTATPAGSGLDVPDWLEKLEQEVRRLLAASATTDLSPTAEKLLAPQRSLSADEIRRQLGEEEKPL
jgi:hypothetical protein